MELLLQTYESADGRISASFYGFLESMGVHLSSTPLTKGLPTVDSPTPVLFGPCHPA